MLRCYLEMDQPSTAAMLVKGKDLYQVSETLKKLCEFSTLWADWAVKADFGSIETVLQNDSNFPRKVQFFISIFNNVPKLEKVGVTPFKTKKACWFKSMIAKTNGFKS